MGGDELRRMNNDGASLPFRAIFKGAGTASSNIAAGGATLVVAPFGASGNGATTTGALQIG
jgi:hypothetical protein